MGKWFYSYLFILLTLLLKIFIVKLTELEIALLKFDYFKILVILGINYFNSELFYLNLLIFYALWFKSNYTGH